MQRLLLAATLFLFFAAGLARAQDDATAQLADRLSRISELSGDFSQSLRTAGAAGAAGAKGAEGAEGNLGHSQGSFRLLRPDYFAWLITAPDNQQIIADGTYLWHFDKDLETVTRRPMSSADMQSPLQVLSGDYEALQRNYRVTVSGQGRFRLEPTTEPKSFRELTLVFTGTTLGGMEIVDNLGQHLLVEFFNLDAKPGLAPTDFAFQVPDGVDYFEYDQ